MCSTLASGTVTELCAHSRAFKVRRVWGPGSPCATISSSRLLRWAKQAAGATRACYPGRHARAVTTVTRAWRAAWRPRRRCQSRGGRNRGLERRKVTVPATARIGPPGSTERRPAGPTQAPPACQRASLPGPALAGVTGSKPGPPAGALALSELSEEHNSARTRCRRRRCKTVRAAAQPHHRQRNPLEHGGALHHTPMIES